MLFFLRGCGVTVAFEVWDLETQVQFLAAPFTIQCQANQKNQDQQEGSEQDTDVQLELRLQMSSRNREKNKNVLTAENSESRDFQRESGTARNAEKNSLQIHTIWRQK